MKISIIVAMAENRAIGRNGTLPWHIPEDLKHFKQITLGKPIVMGRKTFESLPRLLPGRFHIILTRQGFEVPGGCVAVHSPKKAIMAAKSHAPTAEEVFVIGGGEIYKLFLPIVSRIYLTLVHTEVNGDTFFPDIPKEEWKEVGHEYHDGDPAYSFIVLNRT
ncbi:MAG: dihydrofolate reductase [Patescibacteria group bacterium]